MDLDKRPHQQIPEVHEKMKKLARKHGISLIGKGDWSHGKFAEAVDIVHRLGKKIGYENASQEFIKHGIVGGRGLSISKDGEHATVYSIYDPSRLKVVKHEK